MKNQNDLILPSAAAKMLGVHMNTLRAWSQAGVIKELRTPGNHRRFRLADVNELIAGMEKVRNNA